MLGDVEGAGCSEGSRAGFRDRGSSRSLGTRAGTGNGALGLPGAEEAPAERSRAGKGRASPAAAPSGRAGTSARSSLAGPGRAFSLAEEGPRAGSGRAAGRALPRARSAVEECGDNAPSVTGGSRRGRERRRGR